MTPLCQVLVGGKGSDRISVSYKISRCQNSRHPSLITGLAIIRGHPRRSKILLTTLSLKFLEWEVFRCMGLPKELLLEKERLEKSPCLVLKYQKSLWPKRLDDNSWEQKIFGEIKKKWIFENWKKKNRTYYIAVY